MAHNHLRASDIRKAQKVPCPPEGKRHTLLGYAKPLPVMVMLNDNVWRRAYTLKDSGQSYILVAGAEQIIGPHANRRIRELLEGRRR